MNSKRLDSFNKKTFEADGFKSKRRISAQLNMGFFNGNSILFVAAYPDFSKSKKDKYSFKDFNEKAYSKFEKSQLGKYLLQVCKRLKLKKKNISLTYLVKYVYKNEEYIQKEYSKDFRKLLAKQIKLLKPKVIVAIDNFVDASVTKLEYDCVYLQHPATHEYYMHNTKYEAEKIKRHMESK